MKLAITNKKIDFVKFLYFEGYYVENIIINDSDYDSIQMFKFLYLHYPIKDYSRLVVY